MYITIVLCIAKFACMKIYVDKTGVINDPLGQTHSHSSNEHCFLLFCFSTFEKWGRTYGRTTCVKTMIPKAVTLGWPSGSISNIAILQLKKYGNPYCNIHV